MHGDTLLPRHRISHRLLIGFSVFRYDESHHLAAYLLDGTQAKLSITPGSWCTSPPRAIRTRPRLSGYSPLGRVLRRRATCDLIHPHILYRSFHIPRAGLLRLPGESQRQARDDSSPPFSLAFASFCLCRYISHSALLPLSCLPEPVPCSQRSGTALTTTTFPLCAPTPVAASV